MFRHDNYRLDGNVVRPVEMQDTYTKNSRTRYTLKVDISIHGTITFHDI